VRAASERPELFNRVIVIDTYVVFENVQRAHDPARITQSRVYPDYATARKRYRLLPDQPVPLKCLVDHVAQHSLREVEGGLRWKFDRRLQGPGTHLQDGEGMLGRVRVPVDYIYGERSALIDALHAGRVTSALPNVRGPVVIPDGHHHLMLDQPIALIITLRGLLEQQKIRHE
jgi:pimeloyl-ACP methyl ester carboxylesterase